MYSFTIESIRSSTVQYRVLRDDVAISFAEAMSLLAESESFREFHTRLLVEASYEVFRWETPAANKRTVNNDYQFVLHNSPGLARPASRTAFQEHFINCRSGQQVLSFANLGRNAQLIVPCPTGNDEPYTHIGSFVRAAPAAQVDALWALVGSEMQRSIRRSPRWLSTAGGGVPWLHVRIDKKPKYYSHVPYKQVAANQ